MKNPFAVKTPETLKSEDIASVFIDVFSDFPRLLEPEHTFLHGARGTGKSMMLRYLEPQVQLAAKNVSTPNELPYFAVHMPVKRANYSLSELERLEGAPYWLLAEHILIINATMHVLKSLSNLSEYCDCDPNCWKKFNETFISISRSSGCTSNFKDLDHLDLFCLSEFYSLCENELNFSLSYLRKLSFRNDLVPYDGALFGYVDFFIPFIQAVKGLILTPSGPIYLMLDDADNLPERMQKVLNDWVSYRTTSDICLKVSTQQRYKTWRTTQGALIESPHDYSDIDINTVYTSKNNGHYYNRVEQIVERRLEIAGLSDVSPADFFPKDSNQESLFVLTKERIGADWDSGVKRVSSRKKDDITRYATSEFMKELATAKKGNSYSYAGFKSMVNISSGILRFFLEPASRMYSEMQAKGEGSSIKFIPPNVQDKILSQWSEEFLLDDFDKLTRTETEDDKASHHTASKVDKLKNLILAFGECFQAKLLSDDSERRYISFMVTSDPDKLTQDVLDLGIEWGYFHKSTIARKEGIGRNSLYIMNRRLAPYFRIDPTGYAAHMSVTPDLLSLATLNPRAFVRERLSTQDSPYKDIQGALFEIEEE